MPMKHHRQRILWGVGAVALVAVALWSGATLLERGSRLPTDTVLLVNGEPVGQSALDAAFWDLLQAYRKIYVQGGGDFEELISGPAGAYYQLQVRYQAAQQLIDQALIRQEARRRGLWPLSQDLVESTFQERYQKFLEGNGMTEADLLALFQDPEKKRWTQRLLGLRDESVEALKTRLRREVERDLSHTALAQALLGPDISPSSDEGQERLQQWLAERREGSQIVYVEPLLRAHHLEKRVEQGQTLEERLRSLDEAIAAYEEIQKKGLSSDPNLSYYLAQLYNLKVNWSLEQERQLEEEASANPKNSEKITQLRQEIARNREKATQFFLSASDSALENERQLQTLLMADAANPFYYYLYARFLMTQGQEIELVRALRLLKRAIELDPEYADAYTLLGDLDMTREHFQEAIYYYNQALPLARKLLSSDQQLKARESRPPVVQRKLAEAYLGLARQLEPSAQPDSQKRRNEALSQASRLLQELLDQISPQDPDYPILLADLGDLEMRQGRYQAAQARYLQSLEAKEDPQVQVKLGQAYRQAGQLPEAQQVFQSVLSSHPNWAPARRGLAEIYRDSGDPKKAMAEYKEAFQDAEALDYRERRQIALDALALDPHDVEMILLLADFYRERYVLEGALEQYQAALKLDPTSIRAYVGLGRVFLARYQYAEALKYFQKALEQKPSPEEQLDIYYSIWKAEQGAAGPGRPVGEAGQNALWQLAQLYVQAGRLPESRWVLKELKQRYPAYRTEEVAQLERQLLRLLGDDLPGRALPDQGHQIIAPGQPHPPYNSTPPTSGWHYAIPAEWGLHDTPIPDEVQLRNLAAGGVLIQYPPTLAPEILETLRNFVIDLRKDPKYCRLILAPYAALDHALVLSAWNRLDELENFDKERIMRFIEAFIGRGPEVREVSCPR